MAFALEVAPDFRAKDEVIHLHLTLEEAAALYTVCRRVSGRLDTSRRGFIDNVEKALKRIGSATELASDGHATGEVRFYDEDGK